MKWAEVAAPGWFVAGVRSSGVTPAGVRKPAERADRRRLDPVAMAVRAA